MPRENAQKVISVKHYWRLTMNTHTHAHTYIFICPAKVFKRLLSGVVWMFFFFHFAPYTTRVCAVGERVLLSYSRAIGSLSGYCLKSRRFHTIPLRPTMTPPKEKKMFSKIKLLLLLYIIVSYILRNTRSDIWVIANIL